MEAAVRDKDHAVRCRHEGRCATQHLSTGKGFFLGVRRKTDGHLWNQHFGVVGLQRGSRLVDCLRKLDGAENGDALVLWNIGVDGFHKVVHVNLQLHEHIQNGDLRLLDRNQARVAVVHHEIGAQPLGGVVIHATRAVRDIAHHDHLCVREVANDIGNSASVATDEALTKRLHSQTLRKLETDRLRVRLCNSVDRFVYLKVVVGREAVDCLVQGLVVQNLVRNGISPNHRALHSVFGGGGTPQFCP